MILHLSNGPLSGAPGKLVDATNEYTKHKAELLIAKGNVRGNFFGGDCWTTKSFEELKGILQKADFLHFHNFLWDLRMFEAHPGLLEYAKKKPRLLQFHSPRDAVPNFEKWCKDDTTPKAVIAQYHVRLYPEAEFIVPNIVPLHDKAYSPVSAKWDDPIPTVAYAPSNINLQGWDDKGYRFVMPVLNDLDRRGLIQKKLIINTPHDKCLKFKQWSHVGIDEFMTGSYHVNSLEFLSMGVLPIARLDEQTINAIKDITGEYAIKKLPWYTCTKESFAEKLRRLVSNASMAAIKELGQQGREWMELNWNPQDLIRIYEEIYRKLG